MAHILKMEEITGKKFGDHENPLLVSVRSGASFHARYDGYHLEPWFK